MKYILIFLIIILVSCRQSSTEKELELAKRELEITKRELAMESRDKKSNLSELAGKYEEIHNSDISASSMDIWYKSGNTFHFVATAGHKSGCTGLLDGNVKIGANKVGVYKSRTCELRFEFRGEMLEVTETNCEEHGMRCFFSGTYRRQ